VRKYSLVLVLLFFSSLTYSQISAPVIDFYAGASAGLGENKPFWNVSNQLGLYSPDPFGGVLGIGIESVDSSDSFISFDYGVESYYLLQQDAGFLLQKGYAEVKTPFLVFRAGKKDEIIGNQDSLLSIGSTVWSANARLMPKLVLATPGYIDVPFTKGYVEVDGSLAHGWFEKGRYVENLYLHQKHLHVRFGGDFFINASLGLIHFAQWGGTSPNPSYGDLPSDWDAYKRVFFAQNGDSATVNINEAINKLGNHLGSRNYRIDLKARQFNVSLYYQTIFEDNSGFSKEFNRDGLMGISLATLDPNHFVNHVVFEYLHTTYQSGPTHILTDSIDLVGNDNYFNNYIYHNGWTYKGMTLGTPLITSPIFNEDGSVGILNNRVLAFHLGLGGKLGKMGYRTFFTYSINKGTYSVPIDPAKNQFSWYFETLIPSIWQGIDMHVMLAADIGKMYGNNLGVNLLFKKSFRSFP
jgi:Capsule assembly protein Wzi